jgi:prepilin-type N-terminal cleavage/methylation domain-containing protein
MLKKLTKENKGFTIIEVLIVLAIAGLILLIVFLAVPALQRNSRNTQRRNDVAALLAGATEFSNNNNGVYPTGWNAANKQYTGPTGTAPVAVNTGFYQGASVSVSTATTNVDNNTTDQTVIVATNHNCFGNGVAIPVSRSVAALFTVEANVDQCQSS